MRGMMRRSGGVPRPGGALVAAAAILLIGCSAPEAEMAESASVEVGRLVIIGGALDAENADVFHAILQGRSGDAPLCVVPTASSDAEEAMTGMVERLDGYGGAGAATGVLISTDDPERARDPEVATALSRCSGFYFTGGSQSRVLDVFLPDGDTTVAYRALRSRWEEGAVLAGSSAGAAMMSSVMISGGSSEEAVEVGVAADAEADGVQLRPGMGFFPAAVLDQHFLARGRIGRLLVTTLQDGTPRVGLGIDENTALIVDGDSAVVVGASGVVVVDGRSADRTAPHRGAGIEVSLAGAGDVVDLTTFEVRHGDGKRAVPVTDAPFRAAEDVLDRWVFLHVLLGLATLDTAELAFTVPGATLTVAKTADFAAVRSEGVGVEGAPRGFSAGPLVVGLVERARDE